jgi:carboxyl-terminal processing protease
MNKYILVLSILISTNLSAQFNPADNNVSQKYYEVMDNISRFYVDSANGKSLTETAIISLLEKLDPHSTYIPAEELQEVQSSLNGNFVGIGIRFQIIKDTLNVIATIPGGPSEKLGILAGDQIVSVAGLNVAGVGMKNNDVRSKLMGDLGTKVKVGILRKNERNQIDFIITRAKIPVYSVDASYMIDAETGYIKLNSFSRTSVEEVQSAIISLKEKGMKNLIFDLQGNGGGLLDVANSLADEFLSGEKLIVYSEGRSQPRTDLKASKKGLFEEGKLIMLTDEYAASASEILSGAIQDWDRGLIVGRRTFGKGLVQRPIPLSDGSEIRLTIARYYTPTGRFIQKPYDDAERYKKDLTQRFLNGEFVNADSIKMPDSLLFKTLITKRTVYGGGGIMPDFFVPLDTTQSSVYYQKLIRGGHINNYSYRYVSSKKTELKELYPTFDSFNKNFKCDQAFMDEFFAYVQKEDPILIFDEKEYDISKTSITLRLKSIIAQDLWGVSELYQVFNDSNEIVQRALKIIRSKEYNSVKLD